MIEKCYYCDFPGALYKHYSDYACYECAESDPHETIEMNDDGITGRVYRNGVLQIDLIAELVACTVLSVEYES